MMLHYIETSPLISGWAVMEAAPVSTIGQCLVHPLIWPILGQVTLQNSKSPPGMQQGAEVVFVVGCAAGEGRDGTFHS